MKLVNQKNLLMCLSVLFVSLFCSPAFAETVLYGWNNPSDSGISWSGWTWYPDGANDYGAVGWRKNDGQFYSGDSNWYPRIHEKTDYGMDVLGTIDINTRSPETSTGGSLKVYDSGNSSTYQASYWYMWGDSFGTHGFADSDTDRLSFYFKSDGANETDFSTGSITNANMHFGTYLCWDGGGSGYPAACPNEGPNTHFYHYLSVPFGSNTPWIHVQLDQHPTHRRGASEPDEPDNDPVFDSDGYHYFENMNTFYFEIIRAQSSPTSYWMDEVKLWNQVQSENEVSIGSAVWVGYWPSTNKWQMGFGSVWPGRPMQATFEVRWSTSPITNANYASATVAEPEYRERGTSNTFTLSDGGWSKQAWTQFEILQSTVESVDKIYFAIRDVSSTANGDGYNSPTSNIKTIDYVLRSDFVTVEPPGTLIIN